MPSTIRAHWAGWRYFFDIEAGMYYILWISILIGLWFFFPVNELKDYHYVMVHRWSIG